MVRTDNAETPEPPTQEVTEDRSAEIRGASCGTSRPGIRGLWSGL